MVIHAVPANSVINYWGGNDPELLFMKYCLYSTIMEIIITQRYNLTSIFNERKLYLGLAHVCQLVWQSYSSEFQGLAKSCSERIDIESYTPFFLSLVKYSQILQNIAM